MNSQTRGPYIVDKYVRVIIVKKKNMNSVKDKDINNNITKYVHM